MNDSHRTPRSEAPRPISAERLDNGIVAQYIHELSEHPWDASDRAREVRQEGDG